MHTAWTGYWHSGVVTSGSSAREAGRHSLWLSQRVLYSTGALAAAAQYPQAEAHAHCHLLKPYIHRCTSPVSSIHQHCLSTWGLCTSASSVWGPCIGRISRIATLTMRMHGVNRRVAPH